MCSLKCWCPCIALLLISALIIRSLQPYAYSQSHAPLFPWILSGPSFQFSTEWNKDAKDKSEGSLMCVSEWYGAVCVRGASVCVCIQRKFGGQLNTGTQRIPFFSFEVSSNALQRPSARMTAQESVVGGGSPRAPDSPPVAAKLLAVSNFGSRYFLASQIHSSLVYKVPPSIQVHFPYFMEQQSVVALIWIYTHYKNGFYLFLF